MRNQLRPRFVAMAVGFTAALVAIMAIGTSQSGPGGTLEAAPASSLTPGFAGESTVGLRSISVSCYRGSLSEDEDPSIWVPHYESVALVQAHAAETALGPELEPFTNMAQIYTTVSVMFEEWFKGEGPDEGEISFWGGTVGDLSQTTDSCNDMLAPGDHAVVFINPNRVLPGEGTLGVAYVIEDGVATSVIDHRSLPADELLEMLRGAADDPAPTPLPYPDFLPPVTQVSKSAVIAQVAITSTEDTGAGTLIRASVSESIKGDLGKTVEFTMLRAYGDGDVPADARLGAGDEAVVFLRDDGTLVDWYLYWDGDVASSWVDEVSMPVERLLDVLREKVALN